MVVNYQNFDRMWWRGHGCWRRRQSVHRAGPTASHPVLNLRPMLNPGAIQNPKPASKRDNLWGTLPRMSQIHSYHNLGDRGRPTNRTTLPGAVKIRLSHNLGDDVFTSNGRASESVALLITCDSHKSL
jgi:hypothetical protein